MFRVMNTISDFFRVSKDSASLGLIDYMESLLTEGFFLQVIIYVIIPFLLLLVIVLTFTLLINYHINLQILKRKNSVLEATDSLLTELIFGNNSVAEMRYAVEEFKIKVAYKNKWCRKLIMGRILQMKENFQLDSTTLLDIYKLFEFEKITYNLLRHKKWYKRSLGIFQLQFIHDISKNKQLDSLYEEKNPQVKSNALITLVTFSPERFGILAKYEEPLNKADEIKLMDIIYHISPTMPENTIKLLKSRNTSIVILGIKLLVLYKSKLSLSQMNRLIRLSNFRVRKEATKAVGKLRLTEANDILMSQYRIEQHKKVKINILISLKKIGNAETVEFLKSQLLIEDDGDLKFKIVAGILALRPSFFEEKNHLSIFDSTEIMSMARHVKDPNLA